MKAKVCIIDGGPTSLLMSQILDTFGIDNIILERQTMHYV
jgi:p-hydroxybenzoate 3-monooxygenase